MRAPTSDFSGKKPGGPSRPEMDALGVISTDLPLPPGEEEGRDPSLVFGAAIGQDVARQVARRAAQRRTMPPSPPEPETEPAIEPEEIGGKGSPNRRCIVTGEVLPYEQMIRFVIGPENVITPDLDGCLPGRGYWVSARHGVLVRAVQHGTFAKAARRPVTVPPTLVDTVVVLARRACLNTLGLARRAWAVDYGYEAVRQALVSHKAGLVLIARNAPSEFVGKLDGVRGLVPLNTLFTTADLSAALGRDSLAFVAVAKGQWTLRLMVACTRLAQVLTP